MWPRSALFVDGGQLERAAVLAEKYVDFGALLTVCDLDADVDAADARLNEYIDKMADQGFTEFACKWYAPPPLPLLNRIAFETKEGASDWFQTDDQSEAADFVQPLEEPALMVNRFALRTGIIERLRLVPDDRAMANQGPSIGFYH